MGNVSIRAWNCSHALSLPSSGWRRRSFSPETPSLANGPAPSQIADKGLYPNAYHLTR